MKNWTIVTVYCMKQVDPPFGKETVLDKVCYYIRFADGFTVMLGWIKDPNRKWTTADKVYTCGAATWGETLSGMSLSKQNSLLNAAKTVLEMMFNKHIKTLNAEAEDILKNGLTSTKLLAIYKSRVRQLELIVQMEAAIDEASGEKTVPVDSQPPQYAADDITYGMAPMTGDDLTGGIHGDWPLERSPVVAHD